MALKPGPKPSDGLPDPIDEATGLTAREKLWCEIFAETGNGSHAAVEAGWNEASARTIAYELRRKEPVKVYVAQLLQTLADALPVKVKPQYVLVEALNLYHIAKARNDPKTMAKALEIIAKHRDVRAFVVEANPGEAPLPVDMSLLTLDEKRALLAIMDKLHGHGPSDPPSKPTSAPTAH